MYTYRRVSSVHICLVQSQCAVRRNAASCCAAVTVYLRENIQSTLNQHENCPISSFHTAVCAVLFRASSLTFGEVVINFITGELRAE